MKNSIPTVIGISGVARCGKDTFTNTAISILLENGYSPRRISFADPLKEEISKMLIEYKFSASVYTNDNIAKSAIRPLLVWWGCQRRQESVKEGYWVNIANKNICEHISASNEEDKSKLVFIISDCRFLNEAEWIKDDWNGSIIHLKKYTISKWFKFIKKYMSPPNETELKNDPIMQHMADLRVEWEQVDKNSRELYFRKIVLDALNSLRQFNGTLF